ncbi:VWA-like domain-containing protein [Rhodopseudomonas sp. HC1]|uniref:vWA domain-containing protein n=1 Tax=Rhodopseudomonas infernalis TaxID=2897386 RepID=UPI001EE78B33|nr:VWA-like domain-containing protein [Rhodopseudomonas infernalis]MCG6204858.1 VWA-like domain-containing protein [Rhodopseudomonas infernalis]
MPDTAALYSHRGTRAIQRMVEFAPSTGGLALWVRHQDLPAESDAATIAVTDGTTVFYGAAFDKLPLAEQTGLVAHEVLHIALRHPQRFVELQRVIGDVDLELYTICADAIVNSTLAHLSWLKLPAMSVMLEQLLVQALKREQAPEAALLEWDVEKLYRAIDDRDETANNGKQKSRDASRSGSEADDAGSGGRNPSQSQSDSAKESTEQRADGARSAKVRQLGAGGARDLIPNAESQSAPEAEAEHARDWSERILRGHAGDGAFSMLRTLIADLPRTRTPWAQVLRVQLARGLARKPALTWSRPARSYIANQGRSGRHRMPFEPGFQATKNEPRLALIIDVSGSIDDRLIERFANEIETILRRQEAGLVLIIGDERVRQVEWFEPGRRFVLGEISFSGGGGTDFTPLLAEADRHKPDIAVVLTDLEGPADFKPRWPVIWAVPETQSQAAQPFGRLLTLN